MDAQSSPALETLVVSDTTVDPLIRLLRQLPEAPRVSARTAPFNQVDRVLIDGDHPCWAPAPDVLVVWTSPTAVCPSFGALLRYEPFDGEAILAEVDGFVARLAAASKRVRFTFVPSWTLPPWERWTQSLTWQSGRGAANFLARMNLRLAEGLSSLAGATILDSQYWLASLGGPAFDPKLYALGKIVWSREVFAKAAAEIQAGLRGRLGLGRKLVICDLDNTLWGGVVGDDGPEGVRIGGVDPVGESYREVQRALACIKNKGILLAIASKNDEKVALDVIDRHPEMVLRREDFVAMRINWKDKASNIAEILSELNLGLSSAVFLDDSPVERDRVRSAMPEVFVPELPSEVVELPAFLRSLDVFETPQLTEEDLQRTRAYHAEQGRNASRGVASSLQEWLDSLGVTVTATPLDRQSLPRAAQLLARTNQFNLTTRRLTEDELWQFAQESSSAVWVYRAKDRFGDQGVSGVVGLRVEAGSGLVTDFVVSCRVLGRGVEQAILSHACHQLRQLGARGPLRAPAVPTSRNGPCLQFMAAKYGNAGSHELDDSALTIPAWVSVTDAEQFGLADEASKS